MDKIRPTLVVFQGGAFASAPLENLVASVQAAAALDLLRKAADTGAFSSAFLVTEDTPLAAGASSLDTGTPLTVVTSQDLLGSDTWDFHFGNALMALCRRYGLERVVYVGGGAMPLGTGADLRDLALAASGDAYCVVSNNLFSSDMCAFWPASALDRLALPPNDNNLPWLLHHQAGLPFAQLPRSLATQFDIDTPTDLATLLWSTRLPPFRGVLGPALAEALEEIPTRLPALAGALEQAYRVMETRRAEVLLAGRVSSWVWRRLEANLPCQTRIFSEERGMRASGREARGEARSLLGFYTDLAGISGLMHALEQTCNAAFLDTRVLFAHRGLKPSAHDRFASDALMPEEITDPWIRELTEAALSAQVPIVLGGHSLISGGVWALSERVRSSSSAAG